MAELRAVLFDFDGLILDTESVILRAWEAEYRRHGVEFPAEHFVRANVGTVRGQAGYLDEYEELERLVGAPIDRDAIWRRRSAMHADLLADMEPNPGVLEWLEAAATAGLRVVVASSSERDWVEINLRRSGLLDRFDGVATRTEVGGRAKPDPAVYLRALEVAGAEPVEAVALEDSPTGVASAQAAGVFTVAVPSRVTRILDFSDADVIVESLATFTLDDLQRRR